MEEKKMYSAFVSSVYETLRSERKTVIDSLWHNNIIPFCMEYFIVPVNERFKWIEEKIDDSDFFVLLLGSNYGSCDENGISWTEREYNYAINGGKPILAIVCEDYYKLLSKVPDELTDNEKKQIAFCNRVSFAKKVSADFPLSMIISQFFVPDVFKNCVGWTRKKLLSNTEYEKWKESHKAFNLSGDWYHVHLSDEDERYIRIGTVKIEQMFDPDNYKNLKFTAKNYNVEIIDGKIEEEDFTQTSWVGNYVLNDDKKIIGIYNSKRNVNSEFKKTKDLAGEKRGIHEFRIESFDNEETKSFNGKFFDEAPSKKSGTIYLFRDENKRQLFVKKKRPKIFKNPVGIV